MNRQNFLYKSTLVLGGGLLFPSKAFSLSEPINPARIKEFVVAGHSDLEKVKLLLVETPALLNSAHDWGNGDFEMAIGGAGHVGNREIAEYLIEQGARPTLFTYAMLGKTELVKSTIDAYPALLEATGPHGFTLLHHAKVGGEMAAPLVSFLKSKGLVETKIKP